MNTSSKPEVYARFRLSLVNEFRNEFSYIDYRRWGLIETWAGCRIRNAPPARQRAEDRIEVWFNWKFVAAFTRYADAERCLREHLKCAPVSLGDWLHYLDLA